MQHNRLIAQVGVSREMELNSHIIRIVCRIEMSDIEQRASLEAIPVVTTIQRWISIICQISSDAARICAGNVSCVGRDQRCEGEQDSRWPGEGRVWIDHGRPDYFRPGRLRFCLEGGYVLSVLQMF